METISWQTLYARAVASCQPRDVSNSVYAGSVAAALVTGRGTVFTGVSVDTACSLGFCAERNALGSMLTAGERTVNRIVAVRGREILMPCGACREFLRQLGNPDAEVLVQLEPLVSVKLKELLPRYWQA